MTDKPVMLDRLQIFTDYFKRNEDTIRAVVNKYSREGNTIAVWSAGVRTRAFLNLFDPAGEIVDYVYDIDVSKYGTRMSTGQEIADYHSNPADVVLLTNFDYQVEATHLLHDAGQNPEIVNLDHIVLGCLTYEEAMNHEIPDLTESEHFLVAAVVVAYEPTEAICTNIMSYYNELDEIIIYDNSANRTEFLEQWVNEHAKARYVYGKGDNKGISGAINRAGEIARSQGYRWMYSFDQDDQAGEGMIREMRRFVCSKACREMTRPVALVSPSVNMFDHRDYMPEELPYMNYIARSPQSGTLINLEILAELGGMDEEFMLDWADTEYCTRCVVAGYRIVRLTGVSLLHQLQEEHVTKMIKNGRVIYVNKYSPFRYYLHYRNCMIAYERFKETFPVAAAEFIDAIDVLFFLLEYDTNREEKRAAIERARKELMIYPLPLNNPTQYSII